MELLVNLDPDVEASLRAKVHGRSLDFNRALNDAVRVGLSSDAQLRFVQKTYSLGSDCVDLTKALALAADLEDQENIRRMRLAEQR